MSKEKCSHIFQKNGDSCQFKHLHQIHLNVISWRILLRSSWLTWRHCCPCRWGCRCTGSPPRQAGPTQCCTCSWSKASWSSAWSRTITSHVLHHRWAPFCQELGDLTHSGWWSRSRKQQPCAWVDIVVEVVDVDVDVVWDDEGWCRSWWLLQQYCCWLLMLFRTMTDGFGLDDHYNNIFVDVDVV